MTDYEKLSLKLQLFQATMLTLIVRATDGADGRGRELGEDDYHNLNEMHLSLATQVKEVVGE